MVQRGGDGYHHQKDIIPTQRAHQEETRGQRGAEERSHLQSVSGVDAHGFQLGEGNHLQQIVEHLHGGGDGFFRGIILERCSHGGAGKCSELAAHQKDKHSGSGHIPSR